MYIPGDEPAPSQEIYNMFVSIRCFSINQSQKPVEADTDRQE
jgi:hypothetical protein